MPRLAKPTKSKDGIKRIDLTVTFRLDANEIATHAVSNAPLHETEIEPDDWAAEYVKRGVMAILEDVRESIENHGNEIPHYRVGDHDLDEYKDALIPYIKEFFKGID